jgi:ATP-dependent DNA ligase
LLSAHSDLLRYSDEFDDGEKLLEAGARMNLEGIVSKKRSAHYVAGANCGWVKDKTQPWRQANRERFPTLK